MGTVKCSKSTSGLQYSFVEIWVVRLNSLGIYSTSLNAEIFTLNIEQRNISCVLGLPNDSKASHNLLFLSHPNPLETELE